MRPRRVTFEIMSDPDIAGGVGTSDQRCPPAGVRPDVGTTPQAELEHGTPVGGLGDPRRFGGHQRLIVEMIEQRGLEDLNDRQRPLDDGDRSMGVNHATLGDRPDRHGREVPGLLEPSKEALVEPRSSVDILLAAQQSQVLIGDPGRFDPVEQPPETGGHRIPCLMAPVVGVLTEEVVEQRRAFVETLLPVHLRHRQLVLVGEQKPFGQVAAIVSHRTPRYLRWLGQRRSRRPVIHPSASALGGLRK